MQKMCKIKISIILLSQIFMDILVGKLHLCRWAGGSADIAASEIESAAYYCGGNHNSLTSLIKTGSVGGEIKKNIIVHI